MKVVGYGICGPGEAKRYMRETLEEFKRLCDVVVICVNANGQVPPRAEIDLIKEYGFQYILDTREWGKLQWKIKQDFLEWEIAKVAEEGDMVVCLDMDERFDTHMTREWILAAELDAYHFFVVDLWNDPKHFKLESCFWNVRMFRWNGVTKFKEKPVHCGLAPEWAYFYNRHAPFLLIHKGLMDREDRQRKIKRYEKYDPDAKNLDRRYYKMLEDDKAQPFDEEKLHDTIEKEVATYKQTRPRGPMIFMAKKQRYAYVQNPGGITVDIPERQLAETLKRKGFKFLGWADEAEKEMETMFADAEVGVDPAAPGEDKTVNSFEALGEPPESRIPRSTFAADQEAPNVAPAVSKKHNRVGVESQARPAKRQKP